MVVFFAAGEASVEAAVELFLVVEVFFVDAALVVVPVDVVVAASSFFWVWQPKSAVTASAVIKDKTDVFIGLVKLNEHRECRSAPRRASIKISPFSFPIFSFSFVIPS